MTDSKEKNARGSELTRWTRDGDRYYFDLVRCPLADGWEQYDTSEDAWYHGVWVHRAKREVVSFCEGDVVLTKAPDDATFTAELRALAEFYGPPPPAFIVIEGGTRTNVFVDRPE